MYIKTNTPNVEHFTAIPGMKAALPEENAVVRTLNSCKFTCAEEDTCGTASYSVDTGLCLLSEIRVTLGSEWDYFEKVLDTAKRLEKIDMMKTRHAKQDLKIKEAMDEYEMGASTANAVTAMATDQPEEEYRPVEGDDMGHGDDSTALEMDIRDLQL